MRNHPLRRRRGIAPAVVLSVLLLAPSVRADDSFDTWLAGLRRDAAASGVTKTTLDRALSGIAPIDRVLQLQARQPEVRLSWQAYAQRVVPEARVVEARRRLRVHRQILQAIGERYGVQPRFIVALWGIESDFGRFTGDTPAVAALATLAWGGRRRDYFRSELLALLKAADAGHVDPAQVTSSWAGALGQCQFMPSNLQRFGVDYDGDGRRDIWSTPADVFASIARFLNHLGWQDDETWGRAVLLPAGFDERLAGREVKMRLPRWNELGLRRLNGTDLPTRELWSSLMLTDGLHGDAFLVYDNFFRLLRWNHSNHFALAVGRLADSLR